MPRTGWRPRSRSSGQKQAGWRTDPARSGAGGSTGDIGTHAFNLASFVTGLTLEALAADLQAFVPGRRLDDNGHVLLRFEGGARGMLWCSQVATGNENALRLRVYGEKGGLEWAQEDPNYLWYTPLGEPKRLLTRGGAGAGPAAARVSRTPGGHPEGYLEGFANIYAEAARAIRARREGKPVPKEVDLSDHRGRRGGRRLRRGLRPVLRARTAPGSALVTRRVARPWLARGAKRSGTSRDARRSEAGRRVGQQPDQRSASATPTRVEVGVEMRQRRDQRAGVDRREGADHRDVPSDLEAESPRSA